MVLRGMSFFFKILIVTDEDVTGKDEGAGAVEMVELDVAGMSCLFSSSLCGIEVEDACHFIMKCPSLAPERELLLHKFESLSSVEESSCSGCVSSEHNDTIFSFLMEKSFGPKTEDESKCMHEVVQQLHLMWVKRCKLLHREICVSNPEILRTQSSVRFESMLPVQDHHILSHI